MPHLAPSFIQFPLAGFTIERLDTAPMRGEATPIDTSLTHSTQIISGQWLITIGQGSGKQRALEERLIGSDFVCVFGSVCYRNRQGIEALRSLYEDFDVQTGEFKDAPLGHFAMVIHKEGKLLLRGDKSGYFRIYFSEQTGSFSTSFLDIARRSGSRNLNIQSAHEFVFTGSVLGTETLIEGITLLPPRSVVFLEDQGSRIFSEPVTFPQRSEKPLQELLGEADRLLAAHLSKIVEAYAGRVTCALTGGYDSRLIYAQLRRLDVVPRLIVYGRNDDNVRVATLIARRVGAELEVIPPSYPESLPLESFREVVANNFQNVDGFFYTGIFHDGKDEAERSNRVAGNSAYLHGGGGEVFRNFFMLPDTDIRPEAVARAMYGKFDARCAGNRFSSRVYFDNIAAKIRLMCGINQKRLDRQKVEWLYPHFRCHAWFGRESTINNWVGPTYTPFLDPILCDFAGTIPLSMKAYGAFEAKLIEIAAPEVAECPSQYGHAFTGHIPPQRRIKDRLRDSIPASIRPMLYGLRARYRPRKPSLYLEQQFVSAIFPEGFQDYSNQLFRYEMMNDQRMRSRALNLCYFVRELGIRTPIN